MASQVGIISLTPSGMARAYNGQPSETAGESGDLFSALVGNSAPDKTTPTAANDSKQPSSGPSGSSGPSRSSDAASGQGETGDDGTRTEEVAAAVAGPVEPAKPVTPDAIAQLIDALGALREKLDAGELLDPESLAELEARLTELGEALGLDLSALPGLADFASLLANAEAKPDSLTGTLVQLLMPLAQSLAGQPAPGAEARTPQDQLAAQLKSIGDKLGALLAALEQGEIPAEKLAALGMAPDQPADAEIEMALARFAARVSSGTAPIADGPELAAPALKLTEPAITGKTAEAPAPADTKAQGDVRPVALSGQQAGTETSDDNQSGTEHRVEQRQGTPPVQTPAANDASGTPAPSQSAAQPEAIRLDAAANPRIVQSGYQTSQQQLNLPQIAFELARQASDGNTRFQIRLDPPELGRIDVRLDIDASGRVNARLTVDRSETLDLMQRDQRALERALQQAGLDGNKTNLEFSLKQNPFSGGHQGQEQADQRFAIPGLAAEEAEDLPPTVNLYRGALQASGLDIIA